MYAFNFITNLKLISIFKCLINDFTLSFQNNLWDRAGSIFFFVEIKRDSSLTNIKNIILLIENVQSIFIQKNIERED